MGSESDWPVMQNASETLKKLGIKFEVRITSAHRTPEATMEYVSDAQHRGCAAFICGAGMAAHLAGAVAAHTVRPVIGVPMNASLDGLDALLSTVQMPAGIPVATVAVGKAGARNAAYLAAQMIALADSKLRDRLVADREENRAKVQSQNSRLQAEIGE